MDTQLALLANMLGVPEVPHGTKFPLRAIKQGGALLLSPAQGEGTISFDITKQSGCPFQQIPNGEVVEMGFEIVPGGMHSAWPTFSINGKQTCGLVNCGKPAVSCNNFHRRIV
jgi:hypothetical protein